MKMINSEITNLVTAEMERAGDMLRLDVIHDNKGGEAFTITRTEDLGHRREDFMVDMSFDRQEAISTFVTEAEKGGFSIIEEHIEGILPKEQIAA